MTTFTPQPHESEFHERLTAPVPPPAEGMAMDQSVNGDAVRHNAIPEFAPANIQEHDISNGDPTPSKMHQHPPSPRMESTTSVTAMQEAPAPGSVKEMLSAEPLRETYPAEPYVSETVTTEIRPDVPPTVTATVEVSTPEVPQSTVMVSPETKAQMAEPLGIASDVGQPITSDERNAPLEEMIPLNEASTPLVLERTEHIVDLPTVSDESSLPAPSTISVLEPEASAVAPPNPIPQEAVISEVTASEIPAPEAPAVEETVVQVSESAVPAQEEALVHEKMEDVVRSSGKMARERDEDDDELEPEAKRTKTETEPEDKMAVESTGSTVQPPPPALDVADKPVANDVPMTTPAEQPVANGPPAAAEANKVDPIHVENLSAVDAAASAPPEVWGPMTDAQTRQLKQNLQNLKKGKHAAFFSKPVDPVALKIPTYFDVIKNPMDLSTMEQKLKEGKYGSVPEFAADFNLIINNSITFNGPNHAVSVAGMSLKAHFGAGLKKVPKAGEAVPVAPSKKQRRSSFAMPARETKRRESRPSLGSASSATANSTSQTFALGLDGVPLTRRTSSAQDGRPKREIHRPPPRDLPYLSAKPKKKKFQMELKFSEHVLGELKRGRYAEWMSFFALPVDPVALNIPDYHKYIKKPMDFRTITEKLHSGQYENAKEFENDVRLVFSNCYKFNGPTHPIAQAGKQLENIFDELWAGKQSWISQNAPASAPQSPEVDSQSEEEDEDEDDEDDDEVDERAAQIASLQEKIAELSAQAVALTSVPPTKKTAKVAKKKGEKPKKSSAAKPNRKSGGPAAATPARKQEKKPKPKTKAKPITMKEKAEIAERIGELSVEDTAKAADFIKKGLRKIGSELADRPDEELEFDIDQIPDDVLGSLLKLVRKNDPPPAKEVRPSFTTTKSDTVSKPKKNKPMGKHEQEDAIRRLTSQIETFQNPDATGGSEGTPGQDALSSDDEDDSGSESEEE